MRVKTPSLNLTVLPTRPSHQHANWPLETVKLFWKIISQPFIPAHHSKLLQGWMKYDSLLFLDGIKCNVLRLDKEGTEQWRSWLCRFTASSPNNEPLAWHYNEILGSRSNWNTVEVLVLHFHCGFCLRVCGFTVLNVCLLCSMAQEKTKPLVKGWVHILLSVLKRREVWTGIRDICRIYFLNVLINLICRNGKGGSLDVSNQIRITF